MCDICLINHMMTTWTGSTCSAPTINRYFSLACLFSLFKGMLALVTLFFKSNKLWPLTLFNPKLCTFSGFGEFLTTCWNVLGRGFRNMINANPGLTEYRYCTRRCHGSYIWISTSRASNRAVHQREWEFWLYFILQEAERRAKDKGYQVSWNETQDLYLWQNRPVSIRHPLTGSKIWFNQITAMHSSYYQIMPTFIGKGIPDEKCPCHTYYGDGSPIEPEVIQHIRATFWSCAVGFQWRPGDLLALDNLAVQHGRISYSGERKILAYLTCWNEN